MQATYAGGDLREVANELLQASNDVLAVGVPRPAIHQEGAKRESEKW